MMSSTSLEVANRDSSTADQPDISTQSTSTSATSSSTTKATNNKPKRKEKKSKGKGKAIGGGDLLGDVSVATKTATTRTLATTVEPKRTDGANQVQTCAACGELGHQEQLCIADVSSKPMALNCRQCKHSYKYSEDELQLITVTTLCSGHRKKITDAPHVSTEKRRKHIVCLFYYFQLFLPCLTDTRRTERCSTLACSLQKLTVPSTYLTSASFPSNEDVTLVPST